MRDVIKNGSARNSAIESLRILCILFIIAYHFVLHGMYRIGMEPEYVTQSLWANLFGWQGNTCNDIFMLITGYYMITKHTPWKKILLLACMVFLYAWSAGGLAILFGMNSFTIKEWIGIVLPLWRGTNWFVDCYIIMICLLPFVNPILLSLDRRKYQLLIFISVVLFLFTPKLGGQVFLSGGLVNFGIFYAIGGYIRLWGAIEIASGLDAIFYKGIVLSLSVIVVLVCVMTYIVGRYEILYRPLVFIEVPLSFCIFMIALRHRPFNWPWINYIAKSVLGIYLIHDNDIVREYIWTKWYPNINYIQSDYFPLFMIGKVLFIFLSCLIVDQLRLLFIEPILKRYIDRHWESWHTKIMSMKKFLCYYSDKI